MRVVVRHHGVVARITGRLRVAAAATAAAGGGIADLHHPPLAQRHRGLLVELVQKLFGNARYEENLPAAAGFPPRRHHHRCGISSSAPPTTPRFDDLSERKCLYLSSYCTIGDDLVRGRRDSDVRSGGARAQRFMDGLGLRVLVMNGVFPDLDLDLDLDLDPDLDERFAAHGGGRRRPRQADAAPGVIAFGPPRSPSHPQRLRSRRAHQHVPRWFSNAPGPVVPPPLPPPPPPLPQDTWSVNVPQEGVKYDRTVDTHSFETKFNPIEFAKANRLMESFAVLGEPRRTFAKLREPTKYSFHNLILLVGFFHDANYCFSNISASTLLITSNWQFQLRYGSFQFIPKTPGRVNRDYRKIARLMRIFLAVSMGHGFTVPEDFKLCLHRMEESGWNYKYLIETDISLMPLDNTSSAYMKFYQLIRKQVPIEQLMQTAKKPRDFRREIEQFIPYRIFWLIKAAYNPFLSEFLNRNYKVYTGSRMELLDVCRHLISHRLDLMKSGFMYQAKQVDLMIYALFTVLYGELQYAIFKFGESRLKELNLEDHFMSRKPTQADHQLTFPDPKASSRRRKRHRRRA